MSKQVRYLLSHLPQQMTKEYPLAARALESFCQAGSRRRAQPAQVAAISVNVPIQDLPVISSDLISRSEIENLKALLQIFPQKILIAHVFLHIIGRLGLMYLMGQADLGKEPIRLNRSGGG